MRAKEVLLEQEERESPLSQTKVKGQQPRAARPCRTARAVWYGSHHGMHASRGRRTRT